MELSIKEAAALLGRSPRTVRHLAQSGQLPARREGRAWRIDRDALSSTIAKDADRRREQMQTLEATLQQAVADVTPSKAPHARTYSVGDLRAFGVGKEVYARLPNDRGQFETVRADLRRCLRALSDGFHQFHPDVKIDCFVRARAAAANAVAELMLLDEPDSVDLASLAGRLEGELLGQLRGLIRRAERRRG